jgi:hypothetical protein
LVLPWQVDSASAHFAGMLQATSTAAGQARARGERLETLLQFSAAASAYADVARLAVDPIEADYAELERARALARSSSPQDARPIFEALLGSGTVDEEGVPLALYAARQLLDNGSAQALVLEILERWFATSVDVAAHAYLQRALVEALMTSTLDGGARARAERLMVAVTARWTITCVPSGCGRNSQDARRRFSRRPLPAPPGGCPSTMPHGWCAPRRRLARRPPS